MGARYCGACRRAVSVIAAASAAAVWSFQSQAWAASWPFHLGSSARGRFSPSTGSGVEPVVSTPMPTMRPRSKPSAPSASASAPFTDARRPST